MSLSSCCVKKNYDVLCITIVTIARILLYFLCLDGGRDHLKIDANGNCDASDEVSLLKYLSNCCHLSKSTGSISFLSISIADQ